MGGIKYLPKESTPAFRDSQRASARKNLTTLNKEQDEQAIFDELRMLRGEVHNLKTQMNANLRVAAVLIVSTDTGESGTTRTYDISMVKTQHAALAEVCQQGASDSVVKRASCAIGSVTVTFDTDPGNDHKLSLAVFNPDKALV